MDSYVMAHNLSSISCANREFINIFERNIYYSWIIMTFHLHIFYISFTEIMQTRTDKISFKVLDTAKLPIV